MPNYEYMIAIRRGTDHVASCESYSLEEVRDFAVRYAGDILTVPSLDVLAADLEQYDWTSFAIEQEQFYITRFRVV